MLDAVCFVARFVFPCVRLENLTDARREYGISVDAKLPLDGADVREEETREDVVGLVKWILDLNLRRQTVKATHMRQEGFRFERPTELLGDENPTVSGRERM